MLRKKRAVSIIVCLVILLLPAVAYAETYSSEEAQIEFTIPLGWKDEGTEGEDDVIKVKYSLASGPGKVELIMFGYSDIWGAMTEEEHAGMTRADLDNTAVTKTDVASMFGASEWDIHNTYPNGYEYYEYSYVKTETIYGISTDMTFTNLVRFYDGFMYMFMYSYSTGSKLHYDEFEKMMSSVNYLAIHPLPTIKRSPEPTATAAESPVVSYNPKYTNVPAKTYKPYSSGTFMNDFYGPALILSLIVTVAMYSLPIIIYRYGIRKRAMEKKKAKKVTIIYGISAFIGMTVLLYSLGFEGAAGGGAIFFWSWVNYKMLISGAEKTSWKDYDSVYDHVSTNSDINGEKNSGGAPYNTESGYASYEAQPIQAEVNAGQAPAEENAETSRTQGYGEARNIIEPEINAGTSAETHTTGSAVLNDIEHLNRLYQQGVFTADEFMAAKKKLLEKL